MLYVEYGKNQLHSFRGEVVWKYWRRTERHWMPAYTISSPMELLIAVIMLETEHCGFTIRVMHPKDANGMAFCVHPDQTALKDCSLCAVYSVSTLFARSHLSESLGLLRFFNLPSEDKSGINISATVVLRFCKVPAPLTVFLLILPMAVRALNFWSVSVSLPSEPENLKYEPSHDKTNKMTCAPSEDSDQSGYSPSLNSLCYPHD